MKGGHNRLPRRVKQLRGTLQPCRENPLAPHLDPSSVPAPPRDMSAAQKTVWRELAVQVELLGTYTASSLTAYRLLVETVAETRDFDPREPATARGRTRQIAAGLLQRFGLDPASHDKVSIHGKVDDAEREILGGAAPLRAIKGGKP